jgi:bifunctional non-homologous end joining protein LigD
MPRIEVEVTHPDRFTIRNLFKRLAGQRDPWADMHGHARSLAGPAQRLARLRA